MWSAKRMTELDGVKVVVLRPEDKVIATFDANIIDVAGAQEVYEHLRRFFENRPVIGIYGTEITFIREEDENAEDNFEKHLQALREDM